MAVVGYQCTVCKRTINLIQNKQGLDWIGHCNITLGCRGVLVQQEVYPDYVRGNLPANVIGLENWVQRDVLFNFSQTSPRTTWTITHNLGVPPSVQVYVNVPNTTGTETLQEILPETITYNSDNQVTLTFQQAYSGIAQLIARASNPDILSPLPIAPVGIQTPTIQLTNNGVLTIASRVSTTGSNPSISCVFSIQTGSSASVIVPISTSSSSDLNSPWSDTSQVMIKGKKYIIRYINIQSISGTLSTGSSVSMIGVNDQSKNQAPLVVPVNSASGNIFTLVGNYLAYFGAGTIFQTQSTAVANNLTWTSVLSTYDAITNITTIQTAETIPTTFSLPVSIIQNGQQSLNPGDIVYLLGSSPFTVFDKITDSYIDADFLSILPTSLPSNLYYNGGELFAVTSIEQTTYPPIRSI